MIANLEALRALAAWMVVAHHLRGPMGEIWRPLGDTLVFAAGVDIFFILSGVVMVVSTTGRGLRPVEFWARRIARIAPLWWLTTLALVAALAMGLRPVGIADWDAGDLAASLVLWPDMRADGFPGPLLAVGWTLTCEAGFYTLFGAMLIFGVRAPLASIAALIALAGAGAMASTEAPFALRVWTAPLMLEFAAGAALGLWWMRGGSGARIPWLIPFAIAAATLAPGAALLAELAPEGDLITPGGDGAVWRVLLLGAPAAVLVLTALTAERAGRRVGSAFVLGQGAASYAVYLLHLPLIQALAKTGAPPALILASAPPLIALTGYLAHVFIEAPLIERMRRALLTCAARSRITRPARQAGVVSGGGNRPL